MGSKVRFASQEVHHEANYEYKESWYSKLFKENKEEFLNIELYRAVLGEYIGTFLLVFFVIGVGISKEGGPESSLFQIGVGAGFFIAVVVTCLFTVSGSQLNPAVSFGLLITSKITIIRFCFYVPFQILGSMTAVKALQGLLPDQYQGGLGPLKPGEFVKDHQAVGMEALITGFLNFSVLACIDPGRKDLHGSLPLIFGLCICVNVLVAGYVSGAAMNPARALGPAIVLGDLDKQWIYWVGPFSGGLFGAGLYEFILSTKPIGLLRPHANQRQSIYFPDSEPSEESEVVKRLSALQYVLETESKIETQASPSDNVFSESGKETPKK